MAATNADKHELQNAASIQLILELAPDAFFQGDGKGNFIQINQKACELTGYSKTDLLKMNMQDLFPGEVLQTKPLRYDLLTEGEIILSERLLTPKTGKPIIIEMHSRKMPDNTFVSFFRDVSKQKTTEVELRKISRMYAFISQVNQLVVRTHKRQELFDEICNIACEFGQFAMAWIMMANQSKTVKPVAWAGTSLDILSKINTTKIDDSPQSLGSIGQCLKTAKTVVCNSIQNDPKVEPWRKDALEAGYQSVIALPITRGSKVMCALGLFSDEAHFFDAREINLLKEAARDVSYALENIELEKQRNQIEKELRVSEEKFRLAFFTSPDSININRMNDGEYIEINEGFTQITGYSRKEVIGKSSIEINIWADIDDRKRLIKGLKKSGSVENLRALFRMKNGSHCFGLMSAKIIQLDGIPHILSVTRDISREVEAELEIKKLNTNLELKIEERTWELAEKNDELERMNKLFVGRELKMVELKNKIKELQNK